MNPRLHHVGRVVADIAQELDHYKAMGFSVDPHIHRDEAHGVLVGKVRLPGDTYIELLAPLGDSSPVAALHKRGGGYHHVCFEVENLDAAAEVLLAQGAFYLSRALPSVWGGPVCFLGTAQKDIIELIAHS